ncbi:MAG: hypothetical protein ABMA25_09070, partial [Ilumatobacteraceae bacterium]
MNNTKRRLVLAGLMSFSLLATACGEDEKTTTTEAPTTVAGGDTTAAPETTEAMPTETTEAMADLSAELNASGATFPATFYEEAIAAFTESNDGVTINYGGGGTGKGRPDLADQIG